MGKTCEPKAFSFQCMTELTTNKTTKKKVGYFQEEFKEQLFCTEYYAQGYKD